MEGGPLKHLSWSPTGCDLAAVDAAGRVTILSVFSSLNKPTLSRVGQGDPSDDRTSYFYIDMLFLSMRAPELGAKTIRLHTLPGQL